MSKTWARIGLFTFGLQLLAGAMAQAAELNGRHIMIIHSGVDTLWGSALFMIREEQANQPAEIPVLLPKETEDFQIQEGLDQQDLVLDKDTGKVVIRKTFAPGEHFIAIGFKVPASGGKATMTLSSAQTVSELSILTKPGALQLSGSGFEAMLNTEMNGQWYDRLTRADIGANTTLTVEASGIPEGRKNLWLLGALAGAVLVAAGSVFGLRTKPSKDASGLAADVIG